MNYDIHTDMTGDEADFVQKKLVEFADQFTGPRNYRELGAALRDGNNQVVGGITATVVWDWLQIGVLWLPAELRGKGYGHSLLESIEAQGRALGCTHSKLDTFEFEAQAFYEGHGYEVQSVTENFPQGHTQFHLTKAL